MGFKEKNVGSQDLLILQQIFFLLWDRIVLEARALRFYGIFETDKYKDIFLQKLIYLSRNEIEYS